jgi:hypothetical protein
VARTKLHDGSDNCYQHAAYSRMGGVVGETGWESMMDEGDDLHLGYYGLGIFGGVVHLHTA